MKMSIKAFKITIQLRIKIILTHMQLGDKEWLEVELCFMGILIIIKRMISYKTAGIVLYPIITIIDLEV